MPRRPATHHPPKSTALSNPWEQPPSSDEVTPLLPRRFKTSTFESRLLRAFGLRQPSTVSKLEQRTPTHVESSPRLTHPHEYTSCESKARSSPYISFVPGRCRSPTPGRATESEVVIPRIDTHRPGHRGERPQTTRNSAHRTNTSPAPEPEPVRRPIGDYYGLESMRHASPAPGFRASPRPPRIQRPVTAPPTAIVAQGGTPRRSAMAGYLETLERPCRSCGQAWWKCGNSNNSNGMGYTSPRIEIHVRGKDRARLCNHFLQCVQTSTVAPDPTIVLTLYPCSRHGDGVDVQVGFVPGAHARGMIPEVYLCEAKGADIADQFGEEIAIAMRRGQAVACLEDLETQLIVECVLTRI